MLRAIQVIIFLLVSLGSLGFARQLVRAQAEEEGITKMAVLEEMEPADFLGTTALGGIRPLVINLLWMRASDAFERKDWYDALPVTALISKLQPNNPEVWDWHSWNMAYNISHFKKEVGSKEEAFDWVMQGVNVLKKGITKVPESPYLYSQLANLYFHKGYDGEYREEFLARGIDSLEQAIHYMGEAAERDLITHYAHFRLGLFLSKKLENLGETNESKEVAKQAIEAFKTARNRCPDLKEFVDLIKGIDERIALLEKHLDSTNVNQGIESKEKGGG